MTKEERALRAQDNHDLTQGPITKKILLFALPTIAGNLFQPSAEVPRQTPFRKVCSLLINDSRKNLLIFTILSNISIIKQGQFKPKNMWIVKNDL